MGRDGCRRGGAEKQKYVERGSGRRGRRIGTDLSGERREGQIYVCKGRWEVMVVGREGRRETEVGGEGQW